MKKGIPHSGYLEEAFRSFGAGDPEVLIGPLGQHAAAWSALQHPLLEQVRLEHILDRVLLLTDRDGQRREPNRATRELGRDDIKQVAVAAIKAAGIDLEHCQSGSGHLGVDLAAALYLGEVAYPLQQSVGNPGSASRARRDRPCPLGVDLDLEDARGALDDLGQMLGAVVLESVANAEAIPQWRRQQRRPRGRTDQRERRQWQRHGAGTSTLAEHDGQLTILHRRVESLLYRATEPVNLVDEEDAARLQRGEEGGDVGLALQRRAGGLNQRHFHLGGDDVRERGLTEPGGAGE